MELKEILAISGQPGLYKYVAQSTNGVIVESLLDGKRMNASASSKVSALTEISIFDGAMSNAHVRVNGKEVAFWPYGYNSFEADLRGAARPGTNVVEVSLENKERQSRWYPGAGLYRNVHLIDRDRVHVSDMKKVFMWYNILLGAGFTEFKLPETEEE